MSTRPPVGGSGVGSRILRPPMIQGRTPPFLHFARQGRHADRCACLPGWRSSDGVLGGSCGHANDCPRYVPCPRRGPAQGEGGGRMGGGRARRRGVAPHRWCTCGSRAWGARQAVATDFYVSQRSRRAWARGPTSLRPRRSQAIPYQAPFHPDPSRRAKASAYLGLVAGSPSRVPDAIFS